MEAEQREKIVSGVQKELDEIQTGQTTYYIGLLNDSRETVRNFSLVVGGTATGSMVILASSVPVRADLILCGIALMLFELILIFGYLFHVQTKAADEYFETQRKTVRPRGIILSNYNALRRGEISEDNFDEVLKTSAAEVVEYNSTVTKEVLTKDQHTDNWDLVFFGLLIQSFVFITLGIFTPHLCIYWNALCF